MLHLMSRQGPFGPPPVLPPEYLNFTNAPKILAITGTLFALATIIVFLRCYVRFFILKVFGPDDYVMVLAMLLAAAVFACFTIETHFGLGKHLPVILLDYNQWMNFSKVLYVHAILVMVGISAVKISIAFTLLRLSVHRRYSLFLYGCIGFIILMTIACAFTLIFQCLPVEAAWNGILRPEPFGTGTAKCYSMNVFRNLGLMNSIFNIVTDVIFASLPIPLIWQLRLNLRTKISLITILSLGWFACAAAIVKAVQQWTVLLEPDWTVDDSFNVWNYIELTVGIMAASLPALKKMFNWFFEKARNITNGSRSKLSNYKRRSSLGYRRTTEESAKSVAMHSFNSKGGDSTLVDSTNPYNVKVSAQNTVYHDKEIWEMGRGTIGEEDEYHIHAQDAEHSAGIVLTREVRIN